MVTSFDKERLGTDAGGEKIIESSIQSYREYG